IPGVHPQALPLPPADPVDAARHALTVERHGGRTPMEWTDVASAPRLLALRSEPRAADLADEVLRVSALVGVPQDARAIRASADAMPAELRAPFASLVAAVADAYAAQLPLAGATQLTDAQRDASLARAEGVVGALNAFRAALEGTTVAATLGSPIFSDPEGLVVLGGVGPDTWTRGGAVLDPVLLVDLGGDDVHLTSAGGACGAALFHACNMLALSVVADLDGNDRYHYDGAPYAVQGAGSLGAIGILLDVRGADTYAAKMTRTTSGPFASYADGVMQGAANAGIGLLIDGDGHDLYQAEVATLNNRSIWNFAQGWAGYGGFAALTDGGGDDAYHAYSYGFPETTNFIGLYTNGVGFFGGVGVQTDLGGTRDVYRAHAESRTTDYYAQGFGAFAGLGIFYEDGGDDDYAAGHTSSNPFIQPLLNCAFGTGSLAGVGIFLEMGGNDNYLGYSFAGSGKYAYTMNEGYGGPGVGYGLFVDVSGDDGHFMEAHGGARSDTFGRGVLLERGNFGGINLQSAGGGNHAGNFLDLGGNDIYTGAPPSRDDARWSGGADLNLAPSLALQAVLG
ncbi:MAG TPA: hypothetical protein VM582_06420, partial [Candidatus Thermoplasmatota archaeon]|nr:hypothetical protein [Candidatus Thermoplasmatota archaeon]